MKQTQFPSLNKLLETMEKEIMQSDPSPDSFPTFNPLLWLSSPDRTYVADASGICLQDTSEVFRIFAHELCEKLEAFSTLMTARENPAKYILVLCEIMRLLPLNYIANTGSLQILHIIQVRFNTFPEVYSLRFIPAIKLFIANAVAVGANPLKLVYHQVNGEFTPCEIVEQLSYAMFSRDSFIAAFKGIDNIIPDVTPEIRPKFLAGLYSLVSRFFIDCPTDHEELIKTGFPELENLIDKLCKNKSKIEPELIAIIAAFMPMCHNGLKEACENKKSNLFTTIAGKCKNSKERGSQKKFYMTCAIIELLEAKVICSKLDGNPPFKEFMEKFGDKIKEPPTTVKFIESFSKEQRINVFPRIVSISLANNSDPNLQSSILLDLVKEDSGWPLLLETLQYVLKGYPISGYLPQLPSLVYEKLISSLREYMETIKNKDADSISRTVALQTASKILDYFTSASPKFTLYSILSSQDVQTTPAEVPNYFNPTEFMKFDHKASDTIQVFHRQSDLVKNIIRLLAETGATNTQSFILFLQTFFTFNKRLVEGIKNQIILEEIIEIARTFQSELKIGIRMNSPNVVHFPVVYSLFLHWAYLILTVTLNNHKGKLTNDDSKLLSINILLLRAIHIGKITDFCEKILSWINLIYSHNDKYSKSLGNSKSPNDNVFTIATQFIFETYIGYLTKILKPRKVNLPNIGQPMITYHVTRGRVNALTPYMVQNIHLLKKKMIEIPNEKPISSEDFFFNSIHSYALVSEINDELFSKSFEYLNSKSILKFIKITLKHINKITSEFKYDNPRYFLIIINIISAISKQKLTKEVVNLCEELITKFFTILQFGLFKENFLDFIKSLSRLVSLFYSTQDTVQYQNQRFAIIQTLFEIGLYYGDRDKDNFNENILLSIVESFPQLFENFDMNENIVNKHLSEQSSVTKLMKNIIFILTTLQTFVENVQTIEFINNIQLTLNAILKYNSAIAWKVYVYMAKDSSTLFQSLLIESLTLLCGMSFSITSNNYSRISPVTIRKSIINNNESSRRQSSVNESSRRQSSVLANNESTQKQSSNESSRKQSSVLVNNESSRRQSSATNYEASQISAVSEEDPILVINSLLASARSIRKEQSPFEIQEKEQILNILTKNKFDIFKNPPTLNHKFMEASILYLFAYNKNLELFKEMSKQCTKENLIEENPISIFFTSWFKIMGSKEQTNQVIKLIKSEKNINKFTENFNPTSEFTYYLSLFSKLTSADLATTLFVERYLKKVFENPVLFEATKRINKKLNVENYFVNLLKSEQFKKLMDLLLNIEEIYINKESFDPINDLNVITAFIGENKTPFDRSEFIFTNQELTPTDALKLYNSNFIQEIGTIDKCTCYFIDLIKIPILKQGIITKYFYKYFENIPQIQLYINISQIPKHIVQEFPLIIQFLPDNFLKKLKKIVVLNPSTIVQKLLQKEILPQKLPKILKKVVVVTDDLSSILNANDLIYFPNSAFGSISEYRSKIPIKYNDQEGFLVFANKSFAITFKKEFLVKNVTHTLFIDINSIKSAKETQTGIELVLNVQKLNGTKQTTTISFESKHKSLIRNAIAFMLGKIGDYIKYNDIILTISSSFRVQMISFSLLLIAQNSATLMNQALQLFEAAIHSGKPVINCNVYVADECSINMTNLFKEVIEKNLLSEVIENLSLLLKINQSEIALQNLLPLFIEFMNSSNNISLMYQVLSNLFEISYTNTGYASILTSYFLNDLTSELAIKVTFYLIIQNNDDNDPQKYSIAQRSIQAFMRKHGSLIGKIVIEILFDGIICKKSFGTSINPTKIFSIIPKLSFNCPDYVLTNLSFFFYATILSCTYTTIELSSLIHKCYESMFCSLLSIFPESENIINKSRNNILKLLELPKVLPALKLIEIIDNLMLSFNKKYQKEFRKLFIKINSNDNPNNFYLKASANILFTGGSKEIIIELIKYLPKIFKEKSEFSCQKLSICFDSITKSIDKIKDNLNIIKYLIWVTLLSSNHINSMLRISATNLLYKCVKVIFDSKETLDSIYKSSFIKNNQIKTEIRKFENELNISFKRNFHQSFAISLIHTVEEIDSRQISLSLYNLCYKHLKKSPKNSIHFIIPIITFGNDESLKNLKLKGSKAKSIGEIIFNAINDFTAPTKAVLIKTMTNYFGQRTCNQSVESLSKILVFASRKYQIYFTKEIVDDLFSKCEKMLQTENDIKRVDVISELAAALLSIELKEENRYEELYEKINFQKVEETKMNGMVSGALNVLANSA